MKMRLECVLTVSGAMLNLRAICLLDIPWPIRNTMLRSRGDRLDSERSSGSCEEARNECLGEVTGALGCVKVSSRQKSMTTPSLHHEEAPGRVLVRSALGRTSETVRGDGAGAPPRSRSRGVIV